MATKLGSLTLDLICRTGRFTQGMRDASNSASREMGRIESSTNAVNSMFKQLAATAAATFTVSQVVNYADSYTGMVNKLKLVTTTQTELSRAMSDTHQIAQGTASDWSGVVDVYTKFQKISDRLGLSQKEVARITETVTKSVGMSGASADEAQRSLIQFSQGLSLGVLRGQDLNSVMQQTPGLTDAIAKGMGVTSDKLKQMGADNVLTTESVVTALKKVADSVDEEYAKTATTVASSFNLIKNESIRMVGEFDSATGASAKFVQGMTVLSQNMDTVTNTLMIGGAYMAGTYIPVLATTTIGFIKSSVEAVRYQVALAGMQASATGASRTLVVLKGVLGGPAGLGIMAASAAAGFLLMRDSSKDTQSALEEQGLTVEELKVKYSQLNAEQLKLKALGASDAIEAENEKIRTLFITLERYISDLNGQGKTDRANALQQYLEDLKVGGDRAKNAFARLEKQRVVNPEDIAYAAKMGAAVKSSTNEVDKQNQILSIASNKHIEHAKAAKTGAEGVAQFGREAVGSAAQIKGLSAEVQKFISETLNTISSNSEVLALRAKGISKEYAEGFVKLRQMQGLIGKDTPVDMGAFNLFLADLSIKEKIKNLDDQQAKSEKDKTKELERQQKVREKHAALLASSNEQTRNMLKVYQAFLNAGVDDVKARVLTSQVGREGDFLSKNLYGNHTDAANGKTNTGFISWQGERSKSLIGYLRSQGVLDSKGNIQQTQEALDAQAKFFIQEVMSQKRYLPSKNALVGTNDNYRELEKIFGKNAIAWDYAGNSIGKDKASKNLARQDSYYAKLGKLLGENPDSFLGSFKDLSKQDDDVYKLKTRIEDEKKSLIEFYDDWQKLENNNSEKVKNIRETFANDPKAMDYYLARQSEGYQKDVENYIKAGDDRVKADYQATQEIIAARQAAFDNINNPIYSMRDKGVEAIAQSSLSPLAYQKWDLNRQQQDGYSQLGDDLNTASMAINDSDILSEQEKKDKLLQIEQEYQDAKLALAQTYDQQHRDLENQTQAASLAGYGAMFGMMGSMFDAYGDKESTGYKVAFAMQKAFVLSSAILNAKGAVMAAWNDPANTTIWQKMAAAAATVVQTNDLMSAIQGVALTGMAHDGIANVPEEGTWLLSKGERVLNPQDNKALTNMINNGGGGGDVTIQVSITDSGVNTSGGNTQDQRQFAQVVGNAVRAVIIQEKRQGGLLSK